MACDCYVVQSWPEIVDVEDGFEDVAVPVIAGEAGGGAETHRLLIVGDGGEDVAGDCVVQQDGRVWVDIQ